MSNIIKIEILDAILRYTSWIALILFFISTMKKVKNKEPLENEHGENKEDLEVGKLILSAIGLIFGLVLIVFFILKVKLATIVALSNVILICFIYFLYVIKQVFTNEKFNLGIMQKGAIISFPQVVSGMGNFFKMAIFKYLDKNINFKLVMIIIVAMFYISFVSINIYFIFVEMRNVFEKISRYKIFHKQINLEERSTGFSKCYFTNYVKGKIKLIKKASLLQYGMYNIIFFIAIAMDIIQHACYFVWIWLFNIIVVDLQIIDSISSEIKNFFKRIYVRTETEDIYRLFRISLIISLIIGFGIISENEVEYASVSNMYNIIATAILIPVVFTQLTEK